MMYNDAHEAIDLLYPPHSANARANAWSCLPPDDADLVFRRGLRPEVDDRDFIRHPCRPALDDSDAVMNSHHYWKVPAFRAV